MASSGTYTNNFATGYNLHIDWQTTSQDITNNESTVKVDLYLHIDSGYSINSSVNKDSKITINGVSDSADYKIIGNASGSTDILMATYTRDVPHNSDGTKAVSLSAYSDIELTLGGTYYGRVSVSGSPTLDTIPRASSFSSLPSSITGSEEFSYTISRASSSFTHTINWSLGEWSDSDTGIGTSGNKTIYTTSVAQEIPTSTTGTLSIELRTYNGGTYIGKKTYTRTLTLADFAKPSFTSVASALDNSALPGGASSWTVYVQNKSTAVVTITEPDGYDGSWVTKVEAKLGSTSHSNTYTSGSPPGSSVSFNFSLPNSGSQTFTGKVTDSRGRTYEDTVAITVDAYSAPSITSPSVWRSDNLGVAQDEGTYATTNAGYSFSSVSGNNSVTTLAEYYDSNAWQGAGAWTSEVNKTFGSGTLSGDNQYPIRLSVTDAFTTIFWNVTLNTAFVTLDLLAGGHGIAFGKVASLEDIFEVDFDTQLNKDLTVSGLTQANGGFQYQPIQIPSSANMDNYTTPGWYHISTHTIAGTLTNYPPRSYAGVLQVLPGNDTLGPGDGIVQLLHYGGYGDDGGTWHRRLYDGEWTAWFPNVPGNGYVPARHLYLIGNTTINNTVWTAHGGFNPVSGQDNDSEIAYSNGVFTVTYSGLYRIKRTLRWADWAGSWNSVNMRCVVNGSRVEQVDWYREDKKHYVVEFEVYVPANGTVAIEVYQSSGSDQTVDASDSVDNLYQIRRIT